MRNTRILNTYEEVTLVPNSGMSSFLLCELPCRILLVSRLIKFFDGLMGKLSLMRRTLSGRRSIELTYYLGSIGVCRSEVADSVGIIS